MIKIFRLVVYWNTALKKQTIYKVKNLKSLPWKRIINIPTQQLATGRYTLKVSDGSDEPSTISLFEK